MKIYADENIERSIIDGLRRRKIEVVSAREFGYIGRPDEFHIEKASEIKAVIAYPLLRYSDCSQP